MDAQILINDWILLILCATVGIAIGILLFPGLRGQLRKTPLGGFLAVCGCIVAALAVFMLAAVILGAIRGRWCEGCQEYH